MSREDEYEVGYGKPPKAGRFKPGQSGNPKGRKKDDRSVQAIAREMLNEKLEVRLNGKIEKLSRAELVVIRLMQDLTGDNPLSRSRALKELERYLPNFHLPAQEPAGRHITVEIVRSDNFGGKLTVTAEENELATQLILKRRAEKAALKQKSNAPDPLDM